jgi:hypothetical protein
MPILTMDQLVAGFLPAQDIVKAGFTAEAAGILHSEIYVAGRPAAAAAPTPGLAGAALTTYPGQIPVPAPVGGMNIYLARMAFGMAAAIGGVILCDRLWHNSGIVVTTTTAQTVNSPAWPARSRDGTVNGDGVMVALEVSAATTNGSAVTNITMSYTNEAGTAGRTATMPSFPATCAANAFIPFNLQAGDSGVRSVQSLTLGTSLVTGTVHLVAYRRIASLPIPAVAVGAAADGIGLGLPRLFDNSVPFLLVRPSATGVGVLDGDITYAQG